jgi:hypothetical protein
MTSGGANGAEKSEKSDKSAANNNSQGAAPGIVINTQK